MLMLHFFHFTDLCCLWHGIIAFFVSTVSIYRNEIQIYLTNLMAFQGVAKNGYGCAKS